MALPQRPDFATAFQRVNEVYHGNASQERANTIRRTLQDAQAFIDAAIAQEEQNVNPWMIRDCVAISRALGEAGIDGMIRLRVAPPGKDLPGEYTVETIYGKLIGEGAQLTNTIRMLGEAIARRPAPDTDEALDEFAAEHGE